MNVVISLLQLNILIEGRRDFYNFFNELDDRRETDILTVYPEFLDFYKLCQQVSLTNPI